MQTMRIISLLYVNRKHGKNVGKRYSDIRKWRKLLPRILCIAYTPPCHVQPHSVQPRSDPTSILPINPRVERTAPATRDRDELGSTRKRTPLPGTSRHGTHECDQREEDRNSHIANNHTPNITGAADLPRCLAVDAEGAKSSSFNTVSTRPCTRTFIESSQRFRRPYCIAT